MCAGFLRPMTRLGLVLFCLAPRADRSPPRRPRPGVLLDRLELTPEPRRTCRSRHNQAWSTPGDLLDPGATRNLTVEQKAPAGQPRRLLASRHRTALFRLGGSC